MTNSSFSTLKIATKVATFLSVMLAFVLTLTQFLAPLFMVLTHTKWCVVLTRAILALGYKPLAFLLISLLYFFIFTYIVSDNEEDISDHEKAVSLAWLLSANIINVLLMFVMIA